MCRQFLASGRAYILAKRVSTHTDKVDVAVFLQLILDLNQVYNNILTGGCEEYPPERLEVVLLDDAIALRLVLLELRLVRHEGDDAAEAEQGHQVDGQPGDQHPRVLLD